MRRIPAFLISVALILGVAGHIPALGSLLAAPMDDSLQVEPVQVAPEEAGTTARPIAAKPGCKSNIYGAGGGCAFDAFPESSPLVVHLHSLRLAPWVESYERLSTTVPDRILRPPIFLS